LNVLDFLGFWPVLNNLYFVVGHGEAKRRKGVSQILYWLIQIDHDTDIQKIRENVIHKLLEGHRSIGKTEGHYRPFK